MVNLKALEAAIQKVERVSDEELEFQAGDTRITLRPLRPMEETAVQKWSRVAWEGADPEGDNAAFAEYLDRLRFGILGYAIVELDGLDLRDVEYLDSGEVDEKDRPVEIPKHEALRDMMIRDWSRMMLTEVYAKYTAVTDRVEFRASQAVEYDPSDLDDEINRLEKRLGSLREKKKKNEEGPQPDAVSEQTKAAGEINKAQRAGVKLRQDITEKPEAPQHLEPEAEPQRGEAEPQRDETPQPQGRQRAAPEQASPPSRNEEHPPPPEPQEPEDPNRIPEPHGGDSFFDPGDPDSEDAIEAESRRQAAIMRQHLERKKQNEEETRRREEAGLPTGPVRPPQAASAQTPRAAARMDPRTGSLRSAANASDAVFSGRPDQVTTARPSPATLGGKPVYKMPTQTLDRPQRQRPRDAGAPPGQEAPARSDGVQLNPEGGSRNPRFRGPEES